MTLGEDIPLMSGAPRRRQFEAMAIIVNVYEIRKIIVIAIESLVFFSSVDRTVIASVIISGKYFCSRLVTHWFSVWLL